MESLQLATERLANARDVTLLGHIRPDADALGSALALAEALQARGAVVRVSFGSPERAPVSLAGLDEHGLIVPASQVPAEPETLVVLDTSGLERLGKLVDRVDATKKRGGDVIVLDHHVGNTLFGTIHVIDEKAEATALVVLRVLDELGAALTPSIARCLYAGLATDTRSFRIAGAHAHQAAARFIEAGVDASAATRVLMDTHPFSWLSMLSTVLGETHLEPAAAQGLGFVHATVRREHMRGLGSEESDAVVDIVRTTSEAEVAAVFKEVNAQRWTVSLRAKQRLDVGKAAAECGGGGHRLAAGFVADGTLDEIRARLRGALENAPVLPGSPLNSPGSADSSSSS